MCQNDPFHCECRAYGRLKEVGREDLAVGCFGYVLLTQRQEDELLDLGFNAWGCEDARRGRPIRAIVKEYIANDGSGAFTFEMIPQMRQDIQDLNRLGIVAWDVRDDNYRAGRLVDFSQARTVPHMELDWNSTAYHPDQVKQCCVQDLAYFDDMIAGWNEDHPDRIYWRCFLPSITFGRRLRNAKRYCTDAFNQEGARFVAASYDWEGKLATSEPMKALNKSSSAGRTKKKRGVRRGGVRKRPSSTSSRAKRGKRP